MIKPVILLTRPEESSRSLIAVLAPILGDRVSWCVSPLMDIVLDPQLPDLSGIKTLVFTSRHGVDAYVAAGGPRDLRCYTVGDATARTARAAGLHAISASGDADALVARILADSDDGPMLHLRGEHARGDIAHRLRQAGRIAAEQVVYAQRPRPLNAGAQTALVGEIPVILPLFSPRSAALLGAGPVAAPVYVIAMSDAIMRALQVNIAGCRVTAQPDNASMTAALVEMVDSAPWSGMKGHQD